MTISKIGNSAVSNTIKSDTRLNLLPHSLNGAIKSLNGSNLVLSTETFCESESIFDVYFQEMPMGA